MAFTFGFYNSLNGDRKYNAEQVSAIFDGLINDGVYASIGDIFGTIPGDGMQVIVKSGRGWFNHTWNYNDAAMPLTIDQADVTRPRWDAVVIEVGADQPIRTNAIKVIKGSPAVSPVKPILSKADNLYQWPLAWILIPPAATEITASMIHVVVGTSECPFVTGIIETATIDALFQQWQGDFDAWFANVQAQLEGDVVTNLLHQINLRLKISDKATDDEAIAGTDDTKYMTPLTTLNVVKNKTYSVGDFKGSINDLETNTNGAYILCDGRTVLASAYPDLFLPSSASTTVASFGSASSNRPIVTDGKIFLFSSYYLRIYTLSTLTLFHYIDVNSMNYPTWLAGNATAVSMGSGGVGNSFYYMVLSSFPVTTATTASRYGAPNIYCSLVIPHTSVSNYPTLTMGLGYYNSTLYFYNITPQATTPPTFSLLSSSLTIPGAPLWADAYGSYRIICGTSGWVAHSGNSGSTLVSYIPTSNTMKHCLFINSTTAYSCGDRGTLVSVIFSSSGNTASNLSYKLNSSANYTRMIYNNNLLYLASNKGIYKETDIGTEIFELIKNTSQLNGTCYDILTISISYLAFIYNTHIAVLNQVNGQLVQYVDISSMTMSVYNNGKTGSNQAISSFNSIIYTDYYNSKIRVCIHSTFTLGSGSTASESYIISVDPGSSQLQVPNIDIANMPVYIKAKEEK